jgi:mannitol/fructose-specific phosphotransferase system IIA component (Ntr-type)
MLDLHAKDEAAAIQQVTGLLKGQADVADAPAFAAEVIAREKLCPTALGHGVAFPHARTTGVRQLIMAIGRSTEGVVFADAKEVVNFLFVIGTPPDRVPPYLGLVGYLARLLKDQAVRAKLLATASAEDFLSVLRTGS